MSCAPQRFKRSILTLSRRPVSTLVNAGSSVTAKGWSSGCVKEICDKIEALLGVPVGDWLFL